MRLSELSNLGTLPSINAKEVSRLIIQLPNYEEQTAIAEILSTADREIDLLKRELEHEKQKKKALMQCE